MSRRMSADELQQFVRRRGFLPTAFVIGRDALAIIVHPSNPLSAVTSQQLDQIFSETLECGGVGNIQRWDQVSDDFFSAQLAPLVIERYGRTAISGSYGFFKREALCDGDFAPGVVELPGFAAVVDAVANNPNGIAYVGTGFTDARVKVLDIQLASNNDAYGTNVGRTARLDPQGGAAHRAIGDWDYPLARELVLYMAIPPNTRPSEVECRFLRFTGTETARDVLTGLRFLPPDVGDASEMSSPGISTCD